MNAISDWLEQQADRAAQRQRSQVENAKLLATFASGLAAALTGVALQVEGFGRLELASVIFLGLAAISTVAVLLLDRMREVDQDVLLSQRVTMGWSDQELLRRLRTAQIQTVYVNEGVVEAVRRVALGALLVAVTSAVLATLSLVPT